MEMTKDEIIRELALIEAIRVLNMQCKEYSPQNMEIDSLCFRRRKVLEEKAKECE